MHWARWRPALRMSSNNTAPGTYTVLGTAGPEVPEADRHHLGLAKKGPVGLRGQYHDGVQRTTTSGVQTLSTNRVLAKL